MRRIGMTARRRLRCIAALSLLGLVAVIATGGSASGAVTLHGFRQINLVDPWPLAGPVDLVLMRNVLIYFDLETKRALLARVRQVLRPDGALFLGGAETTLNIDSAFERCHHERAVWYRPTRS